MRRIALSVAAALPWAGAQPCPTPTTAPFPVVGVRTGIDKITGHPPPRLNINTLWARGGPQWDLYVLALSALQAANETDELSFFGITGIHGFPHSAWNGVGHEDGAPITGFCPHGDLLFVPWHRPYVALYEILVSHAVRLAIQYPLDLQPSYVAAAQTLRHPYWDWASDPVLPPAIYSPNVTVRAPCGVVEIANPLYGYRFQRPAVESSFGGFLATRPHTIRCLGDGTTLSNITESNQRMISVAEDLTSQVYDIFTRVKAYDSTGWRVSSLEYPHNLVHMWAVCNGTFSDVNWAAFDPVFMLHHCNLDRLVAMWQVINYEDAIFTGTANSTGQYATPKNTAESADSPLKPFFDQNLEFHTSRSVVNITAFGYTYPDMPDWAMTPAARADHVRAQVNALYSRSGNGLGKTWAAAALTNKAVEGTAELKSKNYYTAELVVDRREVPLPATVRLLAGGKAVGHMALLAMPRDGLASFSVPLREMCVGDQNLTDLPLARAAAFLQRNLTVEVRMADGMSTPLRTIPSLHLEVQATDYFPRTNDSAFPVFGTAVRWPVEVRQHRSP